MRRLLADERPTLRRAAGLAVGLGGVLIVLEVWRGLAAGQVLDNLACVTATTCYGAAFAYTRRFLAGRPESAVALSAAQISCATVELVLITPVVAGAPTRPGWAAAVALLVLGAVGTGIAYVLNLTVVRAAGSTVASTRSPT